MICTDEDDGSWSDKDYWLKRFSLLGKVLPVPTDLRPGEHLQGAMLRAAERNGLVKTGPIANLARTRTFRGLSAFTSLADTAEIERLLDVLGIRPDAVHLQEVLKAAKSRGREHVSFFGHSVRRGHLTSVRRVSPRALAMQNYQRAIWSLRPLEFDPGTREMLLADCPKCGIAFGWAKTVGVNYCEWCPFRSVDLRDFPQPLVQPDDNEALSFVGDIVNPEVADVEFAKWKLSALGSASRCDLFQLTIKIASQCQRVDLGRRSASISSKYLERAGRAVLGWPRSFVALAEKTGLRERTFVSGRTALPLWGLRYDPTISVDLRRQIAMMHDNSRNRSVATSRTLRRDDATPNFDPNPRRPLRAPRVELQHLIRRQQSGYSGNDVDIKVKVLRNIPDVQKLSVVLGLPAFEIFELYCEGLLPELRAILTDCGFPEPLHEADTSLSQMLDDVGATYFPVSGITLACLRFSLDVRLSVRWSRIFKAILSKQVDVSRRPPSGQGLVNDLHLNDVAQLEGVMVSARDDYLSPDLSLTQNELAMLMGKSRSTAASFVEFTGIGNGLTFERLRNERQCWVTGFELRTLLDLRGISPVEVLRDLRRSNVPFLDARGVCLWARRDAMEQCGLSLDGGATTATTPSSRMSRPV